MVRRSRGRSPSGSAQLARRQRRGHRAERASTGCRGSRSSGTAAATRSTGSGCATRVLDGEPRVMLDDNSATENSIAVDPFQLQPGEAAQVGDAIVAALRESRPRPRRQRRPPALRDRRRLGIARRLHAWLAHPPARRCEQQRQRHRRTPALGAVRGPGQGRDRRRSRSAFLRRRATRRATISLLSSRAKSATARWRHSRCSAPPATRTAASSTAANSAPGRGGPPGRIDRGPAGDG